jgi:acyl-coenzyme A synthetase/AMP-(fatty) acid ligase
MPPGDRPSLWESLSTAGHLFERSLRDVNASVTLGDLARGSSLGGRLEELRGRSILVATRDQLTAALSLIELDGVARRLVLCPPGLKTDHARLVIAAAAVDAVVSDQPEPESGVPTTQCFVTCSLRIAPVDSGRTTSHQTEWILLTSGTTGVPKMVLHTLSTLTGAIGSGATPRAASVWSTFYDIRRYGGMQIFLRALLDGGSLVLSNAAESTGDFLTRAGKHGVTHISGTPSHWRRALMNPRARRIEPRYVRLSGEIADQAILDNLRDFYPAARVAHAFASTEAGVAFDINDGLAGFPASLLGQGDAGVEMKIEDGTLRIRSARTALRYLGVSDEAVADGEGFVDTGDLIELRAGRYYFVGRRDGIINVGGLKVHPEEVEAVINRHPSVQMSLVKARRNPITGAVVVADVVVKSEPGGSGPPGGSEALKGEILEACHDALAPYKVPATIRFVPTLSVGASGKLARVGA